ncbi:hypothetical protein BS78_06G165800 [Paspalum vaginatum]|nr:hypothetical protein BS78_06G165800 [Paspalum vaginatum]
MGSTRGARLLLLLLLLPVLAISLPRGAAAPSPVYDTEGHEVRADADYYVLPAPGAGGGGGGLTMAPNGLPCPLFVAQEADPLRKGFPVRLTPLQGRDRTVRVGFDVGVHFDAVTTCVQTTEWHVSGDDDDTGPRHVVTGPVQAPRPTGREKAFRVEKHSHGYKLVWCGNPTSCRDLGVFRYEGERRAWLGVTDDRAHVVVFKKAPGIHG